MRKRIIRTHRPVRTDGRAGAKSVGVVGDRADARAGLVPVSSSGRARGMHLRSRGVSWRRNRQPTPGESPCSAAMPRFLSAGTRCAAWLYRPEESGGGPAPCVVLAHGFSGVRDQRLDAFAERFVQAGLAALVFDYRHFGASDGEPRQLLDIRRQLDDWEAAIAYARALEGIDPSRIAIWGSSFSGGHVMTLAARDPSLAAAVSQVAFADGLMTLPALGIGQALRLTREGLRDQLAAIRGRPPHMIAAVGPGSKSMMNTPDAEPGIGRSRRPAPRGATRSRRASGCMSAATAPHARQERSAARSCSASPITTT